MGDEDGSLDLLSQENVGDDLHATWKESRIYAELEMLLASSEKDTSTSNKRKRDEESDSQDPVQEVGSSVSLYPRYRIVPFSESMTGSNRVESLSERQLLPTGLVDLPTDMPRYLDHYFTYTHCWLPILDRTKTFRAYFSLCKSMPGQPPYSDITLLQALAAYTSRQIGHDVRTNTSPAADSDWRNKSIARIPLDPEMISIGYIQALLLLTLLDVGDGRWDNAWVLIGRSVRHCLQHLGIGQQKERTGTILLRACQILDTLIAAHLMLPPHLRPCDLDPVGQVEEDGQEEWEPWAAQAAHHFASHQPAFIMSSFNRLHDIFVVLNDALTSTHLSGVRRRDHYNDLAQRLGDLERQMRSAGSLGSHSPPHFFVGRLFHISASITVFRLTFETKVPQLPLAQHACNTLFVLTDFLQSQAPGDFAIPPVVENPARAGCYAAIASKPVFDTSGELPAYSTFARNMTDQISQLSPRWNVFKPLSSLWQSLLQSAPTESQSAETFIPFATAPRESFPFLRRGAFEDSYSSTYRLSGDHFSSNNFSTTGQRPASPPPADSTSAMTPVRINDTRTPGIEAPVPISGLGALDWLQHDTSIAADRYDTTMSGVDTTSPTVSTSQTAPLAHSSPSFYGDDVDAIFHNLVHLDANDWTATRAGGFQDLGFADDLTFQAFCDDPERLSQPLGGISNAQQSLAALDTWLPDPSLAYNFNSTY